MVSRVNIWFGSILSVVAIGWLPGLCLAQKDKPTIEQILQVWKNRQEKVATARFELNCEETIHKGSTSLLDGARMRAAGLPPEKEPNPPRDYLVNGTSSVSFDGCKLRFSYDHPQWDPIGKKIYQERYMDTYDGDLFKFLQIPASGQTEYPMALIRKIIASRSALSYPILPIIISFRGDHAQFFHNLEKFHITGQTISVNKRPCLELVKGANPSDPTGGREVLYLDRQRDYVMVKHMILVDGYPNWQSEVTYAKDAKSGWIPQSWEYIIRTGTEHRIVDSGRSEVTRYEINPSMENKEFDISFPPNTRVEDHSSGTEVEYVVREDGEPGRSIPIRLNPTYEELQKAGREINRNVILAVWAMIFAVASAIWLLFRLGRRKRNSE